MEKLALILGTIMLGLMILFGVSLIMALPTLLLWNWIVPDIFGLPTITFFQAMGLNLLCGMLFRTNVSTKDK